MLQNTRKAQHSFCQYLQNMGGVKVGMGEGDGKKRRNVLAWATAVLVAIGILLFESPPWGTLMAAMNNEIHNRYGLQFGGNDSAGTKATRQSMAAMMDGRRIRLWARRPDKSDIESKSNSFTAALRQNVKGNRSVGLFNPPQPFQQVMRKLVASQDDGDTDRALLQSSLEYLTHPVVILDLSLILVGVALSNGWIVIPKYAGSKLSILLFTSTRSKRRWLRWSGSAKRWTRVVKMLLGRQSNVDKLLQTLRHPIKSTAKAMQKVWRHRSKYSLLSDYCWWVNTTDDEYDDNGDGSGGNN